MGVPQALTRAIFNWCETGSVAEGARWGPGGPAPFLDLLKTWGWGQPASPSSQTDTPLTASEAQIPLGGVTHTGPVNSSISLVSTLPLGNISAKLSDPLCRARGWALSPESLSSQMAFHPLGPSPLAADSSLLVFSLVSSLSQLFKPKLCC